MKNSLPVSWRGRLLVAVMLIVCAPTAALGQPFDLDTPADSAVWWPLIDDLTPAELRAILRDEEGHRKRFREAVAAGLETSGYPADAEQVVYYVHCGVNPELQTLWFPLSNFMDRLRFLGEDHVLSELRRHGVTAAGAKIVVEHGVDLNLETDRWMDAVREDAQAFLAIQRAILDAAGWEKSVRRRVKQAVTDGDLQFFVERSALSRADAARMIRAYETSPVTESVAIYLPSLRLALAQHDWLALRHLLIENEDCDASDSYKDVDVTR